ncbi:hypothetical protein HerbRD11066_44030 [Herbidospora sp. RD11066]
MAATLPRNSIRSVVIAHRRCWSVFTPSPCDSSSHANYPALAGQFATRMIAIFPGNIAPRVELTHPGKVG